MMDAKKGLSVSELSCERQQKWLFRDLSFELFQGEILWIEGANGSGKSSLLRLLAGLLTPTSGQISWQGLPIQSPYSDYKENIHYLGHTQGLKLGLTVLENVKLAGHYSDSAPSDWSSILSLLDLTAAEQTETRYLSAGQKRRVALARIFCIPKSIWILDEPLTAIDSQTQSIFYQQLKLHSHRGGISLLSSHHPMMIQDLPVKRLRLDP